MKGLLLPALLALVLSGCATVTVLPPDPCLKHEGVTPIETVEISNSNWMFLTFIPIASGDPDDPNGWSCRWFADTVDLEGQRRMLEAEAKRVGATRALHVVSATTDEPFFLIAFLREKIHTTATLAR